MRLNRRTAPLHTPMALRRAQGRHRKQRQMPRLLRLLPLRLPPLRWHPAAGRVAAALCVARARPPAPSCLARRANTRTPRRRLMAMPLPPILRLIQHLILRLVPRTMPAPCASRRLHPRSSVTLASMPPAVRHPMLSRHPVPRRPARTPRHPRAAARAAPAAQRRHPSNPVASPRPAGEAVVATVCAMMIARNPARSPAKMHAPPVALAEGHSLRIPRTPSDPPGATIPVHRTSAMTRTFRARVHRHALAVPAAP